MRLVQTKESASTPMSALIKNSKTQDATAYKIARLLKEFPHVSMSLVSMLLTAILNLVAKTGIASYVLPTKIVLLLVFHTTHVSLNRLVLFTVPV
jgi:hypothetical protein